VISLSTLVQQYTEAVTKSQAIFLENAQAWAQYLQDGSQRLVEVSNPRKPVKPTDFVDTTFERIDRLVGMQRDLYHGLAATMTPYVESLASEATKVTERAADTFNQEAAGARKTARANAQEATGARKTARVNNREATSARKTAKAKKSA